MEIETRTREGEGVDVETIGRAGGQDLRRRGTIENGGKAKSPGQDHRGTGGQGREFDRRTQ